eukprot:s1996_g7.t1
MNSRIPPAIPEGDVDDDEPAPPTAPPFTVDGCEGTDPVNGDILLSATTANREKFTIRADLRHSGPVDGGSTTAPEEGDLADVDSASSSSDAPTSQVGFWRNGQWIGRPRTAAELRAHRGGGGEQRTQRRQQRMKNDYFQGRWKPAWLVSYIQERAQRQSQPAAAPPLTPSTSTTNDASTGKQPGPSEQSVWDRWCRTDWPSDDELSAQAHPGTDDEAWERMGWQTWDHGTWGDWSSDPALRGDWTDWGVISSPWTSSSTTIVPNAGLFPEVRELGQEVDADEVGFMQLTGAERRRMQENGVPDHVQDRVEHLMEALHQHQENDRGPEARWALQRLRLRAEEGVQCLEAILEILGRRMMPRGFWPVERRPQTEESQARWMAWIRQWQNLFLHGMEHHLQVPLQNQETAPSPQFLPSSTTSVLGSQELESTEQGESSHEPASSSGDQAAGERARNRSRSRPPSPSSPDSPSATRLCDEEGNLVRVGVSATTSPTTNEASDTTTRTLRMWRPDSDRGGETGPVLGPYLILSFLGALDLDLYLPGPSFMVFSDLLDYLDDLFYGSPSWTDPDRDSEGYNEYLDTVHRAGIAGKGPAWGLRCLGFEFRVQNAP